MIRFDQLTAKDKMLMNSNGDIAASSLGLQYAIQSTSLIIPEVLKQVFYEVDPSEFMPVKLGEGAFMDDVRINQEVLTASPFERGLVGISQVSTKVPSVDVGVSPLTIKHMFWSDGASSSVIELQKALATNRWDVQRARLDALKKVWDLGVQKTAFLGIAGMTTDFPGLLTSPTVTIDTTTLTEDISAMDTDDFNTLVKTLMGVYFENSNRTILPNTLVVPQSDYLGLCGLLTTAGYSSVSRLEFLRKAFAEITKNPNFKIEGLAYGDADLNAEYLNSGSGIQRYCLYHNPDISKTPAGEMALQLRIPVPLNIYQSPQIGINLQQQAYGQFSGCHFLRPRTAMYFDHAAA